MRTKQIRADIIKLQEIIKSTNSLVDYEPLVAMIMHASGCTFQEIGDVMGFSRQAAKQMVERNQSKV